MSGESGELANALRGDIEQDRALLGESGRELVHAAWLSRSSNVVAVEQTLDVRVEFSERVVGVAYFATRALRTPPAPAEAERGSRQVARPWR
jgi:hypothetical protein